MRKKVFFNCDVCGKRCKKMMGVAIHKAKAHKPNCADCDWGDVEVEDKSSALWWFLLFAGVIISMAVIFS